jgi:two-component system, NarL family, response regulator LiaR
MSLTKTSRVGTVRTDIFAGGGLSLKSGHSESVVVDGEPKVRVLVVDDDPDFVEATTVSLAADRRIEVVGGAANGEEAVKKVGALRPEVVAMDVTMPGLDGLEATRLIRKDQPECRVVLVSGSMFIDRGDEGFEAARAAGASAYVVKSRAVRDLAEVIVSVARGTPNVPTSGA